MKYLLFPSSKVFSYSVIMMLGSLGAFWVSDDFDQERLWFYGFILIPSGILFPYSLFCYPLYWQKHPRVKNFLAGAIILGNLWGITLLLNAFSAGEPVSYTRLMQSRVEQRSLRVAYRRGGLGFLYRLRW